MRRENSGAARPLRFSVCMWRDVRSLCRFAFCFVMVGVLISPGFPIHSRIFLANSFGSFGSDEEPEYILLWLSKCEWNQLDGREAGLDLIIGDFGEM